MPISVGHRAIFSAFGHRYIPATRAAAPATATETRAQSMAEPGELRCSPWEGLYLEQAQPATAAESEKTITSRELDLFLAGLMYGE